MKMWKVFRGHSVIALGLLATVFIFASFASATSLTPGGTVSPSVITPTGTLTLVTSITDTFSYGTSPTDTGTVTEWVVSGDTSGPGGLDFIYQVNETTGDTRSINMGSFGSLTTDVGDSVGGSCSVCTGAAAGNLAPDSAGNNGSGGISFGGSKFNVGSGANVLSGQSSYLLWIQTSATGYINGYIGLADSGVSGNLAGLAPSPEPGSVGLLLGGLFGLGLFVTRRFRAQQS